MQLTLREFVTTMHGMLFGGFFLMALFGVAVEVIRSRYTTAREALTSTGRRLEAAFLVATATLGWLAVLSGTYLVYPWYRVKPPAGIADLTSFPRSFLLAHPNTAAWHSMGMEWKEHIAFFAPIVMTALAYVFIWQREALRRNAELRRSVLALALFALAACGIATAFGALINKAAPVTGGQVVTLLRSAS
jgi:hypothetical protein